MLQAAPGRGRRRPRGVTGGGSDLEVGLLERERELELLAAALAAAGAGAGQLVVIEGAAGLGKSRLLRWAIERGRQGGMLTVSATSGEPERDFSFGVALQLFERWLNAADVQTREEVLSGSAALSLPLFEGQHWGRVRDPGQHAVEGLLHGLFWLTVNLSSRCPLLLAVDDVHWSDHSSVRFLHYLVERLEDLPVALVLTRRPASDHDPLAAQLASHRLAQQLPLSELSLTAVRAMLAEQLECPAGEVFATACFTATGGNPFLLRAIVQALRDDHISPDDQNAELIAQLRPEVVSSHMLARIARLGGDASALASSIAVLGDGSLLGHSAAVAGLSPDAAARAADALNDADIIVFNSTVSFVHPLVRAAVYEEIPPAQRARAHVRAARLLHDEDRPVEVVAAQLLSATRVGEPWAGESLRHAAGRAIGAGNPESAIRYLVRALIEPLAREDRAGTLLELARAEAITGEPRAEEHLREALALIESPHQQALAYQMLGSVLYTRGSTAAAAHSFREALERLGDVDDPLARDLRAGYFSAASLVPELRAEAVEHIGPLLERPAGGETPGERAALATLAAYHATAGAPHQETISLARRAWAGGQLLADEGPDGWAWSLVTGALGWTDEFEEAVAICQQVIEEARRRGSLMAYATANFCALGTAYHRGWITQARAYGQAALDARRYGWRTYLYAAAAWQSRLLIDQGEPERAERELEIIDVPEHGTPLGRAWLQCVRASLRLLQGRPREALADVLLGGEIFEQMRFANTVAAPWRLVAALAAHRLGQTERAQEWLDREREIARGTGAPSHIAGVLRTQALLESDQTAVDLLREALSTVEGSQAGLEQLQCTADLGAALRRTGHRAEARELLTRAGDLAHRSGARLIEQQVHEELRVAGARPRRLSFSGPESLTASERRVAEMAVQGLSNRDIAQALFVTPRTVERHLYTAYKKLGINSRAELAKALAPAERETSELVDRD